MLLSLCLEPKPVELQQRDKRLAADGQNCLSSTINISLHSMLKGELRANFNYDTTMRNKVGLETRYSEGLFDCLCTWKGKSTGFLFAKKHKFLTHRFA